MSFKFKARVLLELGAELISSDPIAIYELIKNALDAGSPSVEIEFRIAMQYSVYCQLRAKVAGALNQHSRPRLADFDCVAFNASVLDSLEESASERTRSRFERVYGSPKSASEALEALTEAYKSGSYILVRDQGIGMSATDLSENYLTVGTPVRLVEKAGKVAAATANASRLRGATPSGTVPLGEKGIGRLSAMRLGHFVRVKTKRAGERKWNTLNLDWRPAFEDPTLDSSALDFPVDSTSCDPSEVSSSGTSIYIRDLQSDWSLQRLTQIAASDLAKLQNPFASIAANGFLEVAYQGQKVEVPLLDPEPLKSADAVCSARFWYDEDDEPTLSLHVDYKRYSKERTDHLRGEHLRACVRESLEKKRRKGQATDLLVDAEIVASALRHLGPWQLKFYWFNRGRIQREQADFYRETVQPFLAQWGGGFLVYRDGYRVYPYGERSDDWLDLDRRALAASAYKLNRAQMAGDLRLSTIGNPSLLDQTNREGFRDSYDREALVRLLRYTVLGFCRPFLENVEREEEPPIQEVVAQVQERISTSKDEAIAGLKGIRARVPDEAQSIGKIMHHLEEVNEAWERAKLRIQGFEQTMESFIHLAGVGLMLEFVAHELSRVTQDSLRAVSAGKFSPAVVEAQLKTLDKRVRILDELSIPGRQIRVEVDVLELVGMLGEFHESKASRHNIDIHIRPDSDRRPLTAVFERGQLLQIVDNLFSNSFYWIMNRLDQSSRGRIDIEVSSRKRTLRFTDNGPGIPKERAETIFQQFVTTKPPKEGRGLGLYISRRLAEENGATLELGEADKDGMHRTFVLSFNAK
nr:HAMP domain-containing sensor histidine kinase [uncultured Caldimonas sp.]